MKREACFYGTLFTTTLMISALTVGGGYAIIALMNEHFVVRRQWLKPDEMAEMMAVAQTTPGSVAVNACVILGYRLAGVVGAIITLVATVLPPLISLMVISVCYDQLAHLPVVQAIFKGMQAGIAALIVHVAWDMSLRYISFRNPLSVILPVASFIGVFFLRIHVLWIFLLTIILAVIRVIYHQYEEREKNS